LFLFALIYVGTSKEVDATKPVDPICCFLYARVGLDEKLQAR
jgi:hypothetical protein